MQRLPTVLREICHFLSAASITHTVPVSENLCWSGKMINYYGNFPLFWILGRNAEEIGKFTEEEFSPPTNP